MYEAEQAANRVLILNRIFLVGVTCNFEWIRPVTAFVRHAGGMGRLSMSDRMFRLIHLPPDLAKQLRDSVDEAFQSLGGATAELILHYARRRHNVDMKELPVGIDELDSALKEILGTGRRMVVNNCVEILSRRLGKDLNVKSEKLSDIFRQVAKIYQRRAATGDSPATLFGDSESVEETVIGHNTID